MNAMNLLSSVRTILTATAVAVVAVTCLGTAAGTASAVGHQGAGVSTQATKEWKVAPSTQDLVVATKEYKIVGTSLTKEW